MRVSKLAPMITSAAVWLQVTAACSDASSPGTDASADVALDATPDTSGDTASDAAPDDTVEPTGPILERASSGAFVCSEALVPTRPAVDDWSAVVALEVAGEAWVLQSGQSGLRFGQVGADAALGTSYALPSDSFYVGSAAASADGPAVTLVWVEYVEDGSQVLRHAVVDVAKGIMTAPHALAGTGSASVGSVALVADGEQHILLWSSSNDGLASLEFGVLGGDGAVSGRVSLVSGVSTYSSIPASIVRWGEGFAVAWSQPPSGDPAGSEVWLVTVDAAGAKTSEPRRVSPAAAAGHNFGLQANHGGEPLRVVGDDLWIAFVESYFNDDFSNPSGANDIHLAVVDTVGGVALHPLARSVANVNHVQPSLVAVGSAVGVVWVSGTAIYICAGCYVDYDIHLALVDPSTMGLAAAPLAHSHNAHGFARPLPVVLGDRVLTLAWQDFHALGFPAVAVMECRAP